jgi:hypothetical protein
VGGSDDAYFPGPDVVLEQYTSDFKPSPFGIRPLAVVVRG